MPSQIPDERRYELEKLSEKSTITAMIIGVLASPFAYVYIGKNILAILNFLTLNYLLTGFIIVPLHSRKIIKDARKELAKAEEPE